ncbi:MAG: hypothetical protein ACOC5L_04755 [Halobacteriota archaeon]
MFQRNISTDDVMQVALH